MNPGPTDANATPAAKPDERTVLVRIRLGIVSDEESETEDNWHWFLLQLRKAIGDLPNLALCSDACKGLTNAMKDVPNFSYDADKFFPIPQSERDTNHKL